MSTNFPNGLKSRGAPVEAIAELGKVWGDVYFVDTNGDDTNRGTDVSKPFATISAALNTASSGDTVFVRNGAYTEQLTLDNPVRVVGESREGVIITGATDASETIVVTASNCELLNLTITGYDTGVDYTNVSVSGAGLLVNNCHFASTPSCHLLLNSSAHRAHITNSYFEATGGASSGIAVLEPTDCKIEDCSFVISGATSCGIEHKDGQDCEIARCRAWSTASDNGVFGELVYVTGSDAALYNLFIHDCVGTNLAGLIVESSTSLAAHGFGTSDLSANYVASEAFTQGLILNNNHAYGCTLLFDSSD